MPEITLDGGRADPFAPPQAAAIDAVQMLAENHQLERFARSLARQNPWEALPEVPSAVHAMPLACLQLQHGMTNPEVFMPDHPTVPALAAQLAPAAVRTRYRPTIAGRYPQLSFYPSHPGNLVAGQTYQNL